MAFYLDLPSVGYDHITYNTPDPVRSQKLSYVESA